MPGRTGDFLLEITYPFLFLPKSSRAEAKKVKKTTEKKRAGHPKDSKNKEKQEVLLNAELLCIQKALKSLLDTVRHSECLEICGGGWSFWQLSERFHSHEGESAFDFQNAFRCGALSILQW